MAEQWTSEIRLAVVLKIAGQMRQKVLNGVVVSPNEILDWEERLELLATASERFLENNEDHIVNGTKMPTLEEVDEQS